VGEGGWEACSAKALAARAGVSTETFYKIFEGPEDCFLAAFEYSIKFLAQAVDVRHENPLHNHKPHRSTADQPPQSLRVLLADAFAFLDRNPAIARLLLVESLRAGDRVLERRREVLMLLVLDIRNALIPNSPNGHVIADLTSECVVMGALGVIRERLVKNPACRLTNLVDPLTDMALLLSRA
jgi:AcrR family transcriptional regulator